MPATMHPKTPDVFNYLRDCAYKMCTVTYSEVGTQVGLAARGTAKPLYQIRDLCLECGLPPLTALVVSKRNGLPGIGLKPDQTQVTPAEWREMTSQVFAFDWSSVNLRNDR